MRVAFAGLRGRLILPVLLAAGPATVLVMAVAMSRAAATTHADRLLGWTALGLLVSCLVAGGVAWVSSDHLARHVNALVATTMQLADGDSTARAAAVGSVPELDRLATSLDTLASRSAHREREVALMHDHTLQKLSSALAQTADSVFITNRDGVIEYVNSAFEEMTGYSHDEAIGQTPRLFASGLHDSKFYEGLWATILSGQVFRTVVTNKRKDGRLFNEDQSITPIRNPAGAITHFVSTGRDITERKRIEAALRRLNAALEDESARIASVLHDEAGQFLSSAHITLADVARELGPEQRSRVQQVRHHLDLAEEQLRRVPHELHPRILDDLGLTEAVRFLSAGFGVRNGISVDVQVAIGPFCPRTVETVFYRLVQEGLTNIGKHARATRVSIALTHQRTEMVCSIHDDGVGFDVASLVEERDGFSLGLTLMRDRIEAVGGTLTILSAPQRGTELRATVPLEM